MLTQLARSLSRSSLNAAPRPAFPSASRTFSSLWATPTEIAIEGLSPEEREIKDNVHAFAQKEIKPLADAMDKTNEFPMDLWKKLGDQGFLGPTAPAEHGGLGLGYLPHILMVEEIARASASVALSYGAHSNLCVNQITLNGTPEQHARFLPDLTAGNKIGALAMSEAGSGSDVVSMRTRAEKQGDYWVLNGSKFWITNGPDADTLVVYAKNDMSAGPRGITAFLVEKGMEGFSTGPKLDKLGNRGSNTGELIFEDCKVPEANVLGGVGRGVNVLMSGLDTERLVLCGGAVGIMQACMDLVIPYVHDRKQFGTPIGEFQMIQSKLADMYTKLSSSRVYLYNIARAADQGMISRKDCAAVVLQAGERATWMSLQAIQMLGGNGYINDYPAGRFLRDAKLYEIGGGTSEIRRMLIARELFSETMDA